MRLTTGIQPRNALPAWAFVVVGIVVALIAVSCTDRPPQTALPDATEETVPIANAEEGTAPTEDANSPYLLLNQKWIEALGSDPVDLDDVDAVFWHVFSGLPEEVVVYPSENYYYFIIYVEGRQIWGNVRLAAGRREKGVLSFAYFEYRESPYVTEPRIRKSKFFTDADGLIIQELDRFTFRVRYNGIDRTFNLFKLPQEPPALFELGEDEVFVMRTLDESGYQFFLLFNESTTTCSGCSMKRFGYRTSSSRFRATC